MPGEGRGAGGGDGYPGGLAGAGWGPSGDTFALGNNPGMLLYWSSSDLVHMQQQLQVLKKTGYRIGLEHNFCTGFVQSLEFDYSWELDYSQEFD